MSWTDERVEILKKMWSEGQSTSQIAKELGGITRNAVIGKVYRLGLSNRKSGNDASGKKSKDNPDADEKGEPDPNTEAARPEPVAEPAAAPRSAPATRKVITTAGQPLPPQPSANEVTPEALAKVNEVEKKARKLSLMELTERTCKWPIGDPATDNFWFCGLPVQPGKPYCDAHVGVAVQPVISRRDRRR